MIQPMRFEGMLKDMELYFENKYNSTQKEKLYELFKYVQDYVMERAVMILMEEFKPYPGHKLPIGTDISEALKEAAKESSTPTAEELNDGPCPYCGGIGGRIIPKGDYESFYPCPQCRKGRIYQRNFEAIMNKKLRKAIGG